MTKWSRRRFVTGLGLATLATACKRATNTTRTEETGVAPHRQEFATPGARELLDPGYFSMGRAPLAFDGDELLEVRDGVLIRRDASLAEASRLPIEGVRSFAVLRDRSLVVLAEPKTGPRNVHHVVAGKIEATHESTADLVLAADAPASYWAVASYWVERVQLATNTAADHLYLPENSNSYMTEVTSDGSLVVPNLYGILHIDHEISTYAWEVRPDQLAAGPDAKTVWARLSPTYGGPFKLVLLKLEGHRATAIATYPMPAEQHLVHLSGNGTHAAIIMARTLEPRRAEFTLVVYDPKGERWRTPLGEGGFLSVVSPTRVVVLAAFTNELRAFDLATGKPA